MNFFKGNHSESEIVPAVPTGDGGIESRQDGTKTIHPCMKTLPLTKIQGVGCLSLWFPFKNSDVRGYSIELIWEETYPLHY